MSVTSRHNRSSSVSSSLNGATRSDPWLLIIDVGSKKEKKKMENLIKKIAEIIYISQSIQASQSSVKQTFANIATL